MVLPSSVEGCAEGRPLTRSLAGTEQCVHADLSKVQDAEVGDGTTSVAVLAGELLREAELLVNQRVHPMIIIAGFRRACEIAQAVLEERSFDNADDPGVLPTTIYSLLSGPVARGSARPCEQRRVTLSPCHLSCCCILSHLLRTASIYMHHSYIALRGVLVALVCGPCTLHCSALHCLSALRRPPCALAHFAASKVAARPAPLASLEPQVSGVRPALEPVALCVQRSCDPTS